MDGTAYTNRACSYNRKRTQFLKNLESVVEIWVSVTRQRASICPDLLFPSLAAGEL